jgi:transcriptional regulator with XRE-family HTH domain
MTTPLITTTELPARLRRAREALGWSREKLAEKVKLPDPVIISELENGRQNPSFDLFLRLLDILDVDPSFLLGMVKKREPGHCIEFLFGDHAFGHANTLSEAAEYLNRAGNIEVPESTRLPGHAVAWADCIEMTTICGEHIHKGLNETTADFFGRMGKLCAKKGVPV